MNALTLIRLMLFIVLSLALLFITSYSLFFIFPYALKHDGALRLVYSIGGTIMFMIVGTVVFGYSASHVARLNPLRDKAKSMLVPILLLSFAYTCYNAYMFTLYGYYMDWMFYCSLACYLFAFSFVGFSIYKMLIRDRYA